LSNSVIFTGWAFSGGSTLDDLPAAVGFAENAAAPFTSGVATESAGGVAVFSFFSVNDGPGDIAGVGEADWPGASGGKQNRMLAASTRRFIVVENLPAGRKIKATIAIDKDAARSAGVNHLV
jgi:hypothetical protein